MGNSANIAEKLRELKVAGKKAQAAAESYKALEAIADTIRAEVKTLALAGESTGDPILDHLLKLGGGHIKLEYQRLRKINRLLKGRVGELVALLYIENVMIRSDRPREPRARVLVGVLRAEHLIFATHKSDGITIGSAAVLPVTCYGQKQYPDSWVVVNEPIIERFPHHSFEMVSEKRLKTVSLQKGRGYVLVGTKAVRTLTTPYYYPLSHKDLWGSAKDPEDLFKKIGLLELDGE